MIFWCAGDLQSELLYVDKVFEKSLAPWWNDIYPYINALENDYTFKAIPLLVLSAYKYWNIDTNLSISMANIFKTLYLANCIHEQIMDDEEGQQYNQEMQFGILIGDYIFGRILKLLLEAGAVEILDSFSALICEINEGNALKYKLGADMQEVWVKTSGAIISTAFLSAARLSGVEGAYRELYCQLGNNIGMAMYLLAQSCCSECRENAEYYINESNRIFNLINQDMHITGSHLEKTIGEMYKILANVDKLAVV